MMKIKLKNISHIYDQNESGLISNRKFQALSNISLEIAPNTLNLILGPSGSGKTTLFDILSLNLFPTTGIIEYNENIVQELNDKTKQKFKWKTIGYLYQNLTKNYIKELSFLENIQLIHMNDKTKAIDEVELIKELESIGLSENHLKKPINFLSGGEKQRIGLLLIKFRDPQIFILDEPTSFLDESNKRKVLDFILNLKQENKTILVATHDYKFLEICDDLFLLLNGQICSRNAINIISSLMYESLKFNMEPSSSAKLLKIPKLIYQYIEKKTFFHYLIDKSENNIKITFEMVENEDIMKEKDQNWIFIKDQETSLPENLLVVIGKKEYFWEVTPKNFRIIFTNNE